MTSLRKIGNLLFSWSALRHLRDLVIINAGAYFVYMFVRRVLILDIEPVAFENAIRVTSLEISAGFLWEPGWQAWIVAHSKSLALFFNWLYIITFWPIIVALGVVLYVKDRQKYFHYRNVVLLSLALALLGFGLFPLAPPRFLPEFGFVDTIQQFGPAWYGSREMAIYYNAFAAMPSVHFAWTVLFGIFFLRSKSLWLKPFGVIYPGMTFLAIILTGNHYIMDAVGGAVIITMTFAIYQGFLRIRSRAPRTLAVGKTLLSPGYAHVQGTLLRWRIRAARAVAIAGYHLGLESLSGKNRKRGFSLNISSAKAKRT